jgi:hypothetical protein
MTKLIRIPVPFALLALALASSSGAHADSHAQAAALKRCPTPRSFTTGPFFAGRVKARGVSCRVARRQVKRWGRTDDCVAPANPRDRVCRAGGYRCEYRRVGYELGRVRCTAPGRAVGFEFGS